MLATELLSLEREATDAAVGVRRWVGRSVGLEDSSSDGVEEEDCEVGGEVVLYTLAQGALERKVGPRSGRESAPTPLLPG